MSEFSDIPPELLEAGTGTPQTERQEEKSEEEKRIEKVIEDNPEIKKRIARLEEEKTMYREYVSQVLESSRRNSSARTDMENKYAQVGDIVTGLKRAMLNIPDQSHKLSVEAWAITRNLEEAPYVFQPKTSWLKFIVLAAVAVSFAVLLASPAGPAAAAFLVTPGGVIIAILILVSLIVFMLRTK